MQDLFSVGDAVRRMSDGRVGSVAEAGLQNGLGNVYVQLMFEDGESTYVYERELEPVFSNSTRSKAMTKLNVSNPTVKEFIVKATYANPLQGVRETREFDTEAQAKDYAARSVVDANKGAEAYIYRLERVARLPLPEVDWQSNRKE